MCKCFVVDGAIQVYCRYCPEHGQIVIDHLFEQQIKGE